MDFMVFIYYETCVSEPAKTLISQHIYFRFLLKIFIMERRKRKGSESYGIYLKPAQFFIFLFLKETKWVDFTKYSCWSQFLATKHLLTASPPPLSPPKVKSTFREPLLLISDGIWIYFSMLNNFEGNKDFQKNVSQLALILIGWGPLHGPNCHPHVDLHSFLLYLCRSSLAFLDFL